MMNNEIRQLLDGVRRGLQHDGTARIDGMVAFEALRKELATNDDEDEDGGCHFARETALAAAVKLVGELVTPRSVEALVLDPTKLGDVAEFTLEIADRFDEWLRR